MALGQYQQGGYGQDFASERSSAQAESAVAGFMWTVYRWMSIGVALTGFIAYLVAHSFLFDIVMGNPFIFYGAIGLELLLVFTYNRVAQRLSFAGAAGVFLAYAALNGVTLSYIFMAYTASSIASVFFVTAGAFAALSFYGYVTKRDLSAMGKFLFIALIGILISVVVNIFVQSAAFSLGISVLGVLVFAGLTAYDNQKLKTMFQERGAGGNLALMGALILYLDFINMFLFLLRLMGNSDD